MSNNVETKDQRSEYEKNLDKAIALLKGDALFSKERLPNDLVGEIVAELTAEKRNDLVTTFKTSVKEILAKKMAFDAEMKKSEEALEKIRKEKEKDLNESLKKLFRMVENIDEIEASYIQTLTNVK